MPVAFGNKRGAVMGKSKLTKALQSGFVLHSALDEERIWQVADEVCRNYPRRKSLRGTQGPMVFFPRGSKQRSMGFGTLNKDEKSLLPQWTLRVTGSGPDYVLALVHAKLSNGKIESVEDLETFVNAFERALSDLDPGATITTCQPT